MKRRVWIVLLAILLLPAAPGLADARGGHRGHGKSAHRGHGYGHHHGHYGAYYRRHDRPHLSFYLGPWWYPAYAHRYRSPYAYWNEATVVVEQAPVYVERYPSAQPPPAPTAPSAFWHYCESREDYYPDVARCPEGWVKVVAMAIRRLGRSGSSSRRATRMPGSVPRPRPSGSSPST